MAGALLLGVLVPGLALQAPAAVADTQGTDEPVSFTVAIQNEVDSFNPFLGIEATSYEMWALTYDYVIGYDNATMQPNKTGLASDWESSDDGLTWTFTIREGVEWSDGEPLTAADIAYTLSRVIDGGPDATTWRPYIKGAARATAPDDTTVVLEFDRPNASMPLLPVPIIPEHVWSDVSEDDVKTYKAEPTGGQPVVGSGPFRLVEGQAGGSTYRFEANPDYWGGAPHIDEIVFRVYKSEDPAIQALLKGEVDFAHNLNAVQVESLQNEDGITAHMGDSPGFSQIGFNVGSIDTETGEPIGDPNPAVADRDFRYALGFGIDTGELVERVFQGAGQPGTTIVPPAYPEFHWEPPEDVAFRYDPERAAELLDEAGYTMGDDGFRTMPNGDAIEPLRLYARSESATSVDTMTFFQEWLADLGIRSDVSAVESSRLTDILLEGTYDAFEWGWFVEPDPGGMLSYLTCDQLGGWNDAWYCNEEYDRLYEQQQTETDPEARAEIVKQMQEIFYLDAPYLLTVYDTYGEAFRSDRFACLQPQPDPGGVWIMQYGVSSYMSIRPADEAGDCGGLTSATEATEGGAEDDGLSTGVLIGLGVAAAVVVAGGVLLAMRRRATTADRE